MSMAFSFCVQTVLTHIFPDPRLDVVNRNRKSDALRRIDDQGVDTDDFTQYVDERTAAVPRIDGRIRLNDVPVIAIGYLQWPVFPLMTPTVTVWFSPIGLPTAITHSPTSTVSALPKRRGFNGWGGCTLITAKSRSSSDQTL